MKYNYLVLLSALLAAMSLSAARHVGFQMDAFNRVCPSSFRQSAVFSPVSFEIDCALIAESLETIPKANVSETMGIVLDFESTFRPVLDALSVRTNGLSVVAARGFCLPELKGVSPQFRHYLEEVYGAEVLPFSPREGAENWFRATMDGEMEDFSLPLEKVSSNRYSLYDLVSVSAEWLEPFPMANTREMPFHPDDTTNTVPVSFMSDVRRADVWENDDYTLLKLPLKGDAFFYAMLPKEGSDLLSVRQDLSSFVIDRILSVTKSITEKGVSHGPCVIVLPKFDLCSRTAFSPILTYFQIPTKGLVRIAGERPAREHVQAARFRLAEHGRYEKPVLRKPPEQEIPIDATTKKLVFNRPFMFFVYHESSATVLLAGQFFGR